MESVCETRFCLHNNIHTRSDLRHVAIIEDISCRMTSRMPNSVPNTGDCLDASTCCWWRPMRQPVVTVSDRGHSARAIIRSVVADEFLKDGALIDWFKWRRHFRAVVAGIIKRSERRGERIDLCVFHRSLTHRWRSA